MDEPVYVRIERPEGYEDVCADLVIEDANISPAFPVTDATDEVAALRAENARLRGLLREAHPLIIHAANLMRGEMARASAGDMANRIRAALAKGDDRE